MKNKNIINWFVEFVKNFMFGFIIIYGLITPALNSEISSYVYKNWVIGRELLANSTIALVESITIVFIKDESKSKLLDADKLFLKSLFAQNYLEKCIPRGVFYTPLSFFIPSLTI